jgi:hypothetical protein
MTTITRNQPTQLQSKLFTNARAARLLGVKTCEVEYCYPLANGNCLVLLYSQWEGIELKISSFVLAYGAERKQRANAIIATPNLFNDSQWTTYNETKESRYLLILKHDHIHCECKDWSNSSELFGTNKVACKHTYAVLKKLGYGSLNDYVVAGQNRYTEPQDEDLAHLR